MRRRSQSQDSQSQRKEKRSQEDQGQEGSSAGPNSTCSYLVEPGAADDVFNYLVDRQDPPGDDSPDCKGDTNEEELAGDEHDDRRKDEDPVYEGGDGVKDEPPPLPWRGRHWNGLLVAKKVFF